MRKSYSWIAATNRTRDRQFHSTIDEQCRLGRSNAGAECSRVGNSDGHTLWGWTIATRSGKLGLGGDCASVGCAGLGLAAGRTHSRRVRTHAADNTAGHSCRHTSIARAAKERSAIRGHRRSGGPVADINCRPALVENSSRRFYTFQSLRYHETPAHPATGTPAGRNWDSNRRCGGRFFCRSGDASSLAFWFTGTVEVVHSLVGEVGVHGIF
jgi:hypothetical protein